MIGLAAAALAALNPIVAHDSRESYPLSSVGGGAPAAYGRATPARAQHSGAERCGSAAVTLRGGRPVVLTAHGSHASYLRAGTRDRIWPDPNDEADGCGAVVSPRLVEITRSSPAWMRRPAPWGDSRGRWWIPPEQDSPHGPAFQPDRWDAEAFAAAAGPCRVACDEVGECDAAREGSHR